MKKHLSMQNTNTETELSTQSSTSTLARVFIASAVVGGGLAIAAAFFFVSINPDPIPGGGTTTTTSAAVTSFSMASHSNHTVASINGALWGWGMNNEGAIGDGSVSYLLSLPGTVPPYTVNNDRQYPTPLPMPSGATFTAVDAGNDHSLALQSNGSLWAWGSNQMNQLGFK